MINIGFFKKKSAKTGASLAPSRQLETGRIDLPSPMPFEMKLYESLRSAVPVIDAAISKTVRLTGGFKVICSDESLQGELDDFVDEVKTGLSGQGLQCFIDGYLDSLLTYGSAVGEIILDPASMKIAGLFNANPSDVEVRAGDNPLSAKYFVKAQDGLRQIQIPELILFTALNPLPGQAYGRPVLRGLPYISSILMRIYECIGQNFDRAGNIRYAVTYKPQDSADRAYAKERAEQIAKEWSDGMQAAKYGQIRDFVAVGDVEIKVIGADAQILDTEIPVRQLLEQIVAKLSIPPFLLGLNWNSTERMSAQQADILTSELEYYRRLLTPVIKRIAECFLRLSGSFAKAEVEWDDINLQDEVELADARLKTAQAMEIEQRLSPDEKF